MNLLGPDEKTGKRARVCRCLWVRRRVLINLNLTVRRESRSQNLSKSNQKSSKINEKLTKKRANIIKKSMEKPSKINLRAVPGGPWRLLAANTEKERGTSVFWDPLGAV